MNKLIFSTFCTENYLLQNCACLNSFLRFHNNYSGHSVLIENFILSDQNYATDGISSFQKGNTIKWRLLLDLTSRYKKGDYILFTDSDALFFSDIGQTNLFDELRSVDVVFQGQNEGVNEAHLHAAHMRWKCDINIGFILFQNSPRVVNFLHEILNLANHNRANNINDNPSNTEKPTYGWDQMVVNEYLFANPSSLSFKLADYQSVGRKGSFFRHDLAAKRSPGYKDSLISSISSSFSY